MFFKGNRDQMFFELLRAATENAVNASNLLIKLLDDPTLHPELAPALKTIERKGDQLTHDLFALINKTFVTPLEREDLAALASAIDSVVDGMEATAARIGIYKVQKSDRFLKEFGQVLQAQCSELVSAIDLLAGNKLLMIQDRTIQINQLENQADEALRAGLSALYEDAHHDVLSFITLKELYEVLEETTDRAEDVASTLEGVVMKHV